jgi:hypothetical protein
MKPVFDIFDHYLNGSVKTRIYGIFITWMIVLHLDLIYFATFVDQSLVSKTTGMLKNEYISLHYFSYTTWQFWVFETVKLAIASLFAYLMIWQFPRWITSKAYEREIDDEYKLRSKKIKVDSKLEKEKDDLANKQLKVIEKENTVQQRQEQIIKSESQEWDEEYMDFKRSTMFSHFSEIIESIFEHYGKVKVTNYDGRVIFSINTDLLAYINSNNLADLNQKEGRITLTAKGKHFIKKFQFGD